MASLVLMCGLPFSGKSTRAEKIKHDDYRNRCTILSIDKMRELFPTAREDTLYEKLIQKINDIIKNDKDMVKISKEEYQLLVEKATKYDELMAKSSNN